MCLLLGLGDGLGSFLDRGLLFLFGLLLGGLGSFLVGGLFFGNGLRVFGFLLGGLGLDLGLGCGLLDLGLQI